jgi:uncharacterized Tic20 family protein
MSDKPKRAADVAPDDEIDLAAMVRDCESASERLRDDAGRDERSRAAREVESDLGRRLSAEEKLRAGAPHHDADRKSAGTGSSPDWARDLGKWGEEMGRQGERWGREMGKRGEDFAHRFGDKFPDSMRRKRAEFFEHPYDADQQPIDIPSTEQERTMAALAHGSVWLSVVAGLFSGGLLVPFLVFIPFLMYLNYRGRSDFIAQNALQAFVMQLVCTIGWVAIVTVSGIIGVVLTVILAITLVGILAIPFLWLGLILFWVASLAMPLAAPVLGLIGVFQSLQGKVYQYPYTGRWLNRQTGLNTWRTTV